MHEGVYITPGEEPFRAGLDGDIFVGVGSLARAHETAPPGTHYLVDGDWRQPRGGPPPPPCSLALAGSRRRPGAGPARRRRGPQGVRCVA